MREILLAAYSFQRELCKISIRSGYPNDFVFEMALFNLSSHKGVVSYDESYEKQVYSPFKNFGKEI